MIGIVIVSHSAALASGVVELAREMGGEGLRVEAAGGMEDGSVGTDVQRVRAAIESARSDDGVLVLMDLGSALMSAEMAVEMLDGAVRVKLSEAPLVEGAVAAAAAARGGASLDEVAAEARRALEMKSAQLGSGDGGESIDRAADVVADAQATIPILNEIGLHARPAALVVELAGRFDADLRLGRAGGAPPVSARSLTSLMTLVARKGDQLVATASGPQAHEAVTALEELARDGFGEGVAVGAQAAAGAGASAARAPRAPPPPSPPPAATVSEPPPEPGTLLHGLAASAGIALGPVRRLAQQLGAPPERPSAGREVEWQRLQDARGVARTAIERDRDRVAARGAAGEAAIFDAHLALLEDDALLSTARARIDAGSAAEGAWYAASEQTAAALRGLDDELLRERAADVQDTGRRVLAALAGHELTAGIDAEGVLVVSELTPGEAATLDPDLVHGIATARGTATAHAAILARALGIPAAVGLGPAVLSIAEHTPVLLDGGEGTLLVAPSKDQADEALRARELAAQRRRAAQVHASEPAVMRDGTVIEVAANLGGAGGAGAAVELGADGVGLLRTEFLFLDRLDIPSEDEQVQTLMQIARALDGRPLIVRTLDVGADKPLPAVPMDPEANPFLGQRGIRLSLQQPELLATQLRAVLRVAAEHPVKVMFPMVATASELEAAVAAFEAARGATGVRAAVEVGIMVEVPSAALRAGQLAQTADFFSIGTNDLTQYTMAAERGNEHVGDLLSGPQPAVLELVRATTAGAREHGRWVGVCGELAGDPAAALLLVGLGVRELSMAPPLVAEVKEALRSVALADAAAAARQALQAVDAVQARGLAAALL